jgi:valyl-tRNA synthetase
MELLHPFMPFITEEIWQHLPHEGQTVMKAAWPKGDDGLWDDEAETIMHIVMDVIKAVRNLRAEMNIPPGKQSDLILMAIYPEVFPALEQGKPYIERLAAVNILTIGPVREQKPDQAVMAAITGVEVYLPLEGLVDVAKELARLGKEQVQLGQEIKRLTGKLSNEGFLAKAPQDVVEKEHMKLKDCRERLEALDRRVTLMGGTR